MGKYYFLRSCGNKVLSKKIKGIKQIILTLDKKREFIFPKGPAILNYIVCEEAVVSYLVNQGAFSKKVEIKESYLIIKQGNKGKRWLALYQEEADG